MSRTPHPHHHRCPKVPPGAAALAKLGYNRGAEMPELYPKGLGVGLGGAGRAGAERGGRRLWRRRRPRLGRDRARQPRRAPRPHGRPVRLRGVRLQVLGKEVSPVRAREPPRPHWGGGRAAPGRAQTAPLRAGPSGRPAPGTCPALPSPAAWRSWDRGARLLGRSGWRSESEGAPTCRLAWGWPQGAG